MRSSDWREALIAQGLDELPRGTCSRASIAAIMAIAVAQPVSDLATCLQLHTSSIADVLHSLKFEPNELEALVASMLGVGITPGHARGEESVCQQRHKR